LRKTDPRRDLEDAFEEKIRKGLPRKEEPDKSYEETMREALERAELEKPRKAKQNDKNFNPFEDVGGGEWV
jgi:hypothetical protein